MYTDQQLFDYPEVIKVPKEKVNPADFTTTVARTPGWKLVANRHGVQGYHLIKSVGMFSSVVTNCGLIGRVVPEEQMAITECMPCRDAN